MLGVLLIEITFLEMLLPGFVVGRGINGVVVLDLLRDIRVSIDPGLNSRICECIRCDQGTSWWSTGAIGVLLNLDGGDGREKSHDGYGLRILHFY